MCSVYLSHASMFSKCLFWLPGICCGLNYSSMFILFISGWMSWFVTFNVLNCVISDRKNYFWCAGQFAQQAFSALLFWANVRHFSQLVTEYQWSFLFSFTDNDYIVHWLYYLTQPLYFGYMGTAATTKVLNHRCTHWSQVVEINWAFWPFHFELE